MWAQPPAPAHCMELHHCHKSWQNTGTLPGSLTGPPSLCPKALYLTKKCCRLFRQSLEQLPLTSCLPLVGAGLRVMFDVILPTLEYRGTAINTTSLQVAFQWGATYPNCSPTGKVCANEPFKAITRELNMSGVSIYTKSTGLACCYGEIIWCSEKSCWRNLSVQSC